MPCGEKCKAILDGLVRTRSKADESLSCMQNSILVNITNGGAGLTSGQLTRLRAKADALALEAQDIATELMSATEVAP